ncbi:hypothetical protein ES708_26316 [subsurface metagenome]
MNIELGLVIILAWCSFVFLTGIALMFYGIYRCFSSSKGWHFVASKMGWLDLEA